MLRFKNYIQLTEGRQRGVLYHFTTLQFLEYMVDKDMQAELGSSQFKLLTDREGISLSRNYMIPTHPMTPRGGLTLRNGYNVRIALNGNTLSDNYQITPVLGFSDDAEIKGAVTDIFSSSGRMNRNSSEMEELVISKRGSVDLKKHIIKIDVIGFIPTKVLDECDKMNIQIESCKIFHKIVI